MFVPIRPIGTLLCVAEDNARAGNAAARRAKSGLRLCTTFTMQAPRPLCRHSVSVD